MPSAERSRSANRIMISGPHVNTVAAFGSMSTYGKSAVIRPSRCGQSASAMSTVRCTSSWSS